MKPTLVCIACLLLISATLAYGRLSIQSDGDRAWAATAGKARNPLITVKGSVEGLYPGVSASVPLKISTRKRRPVRIRWVDAVVGNAGPGCLAANLQTGRRTVKKTVRRRARISIKLQIAMLPSAPDACQGATFPLEFVSRAKTRKSAR